MNHTLNLTNEDHYLPGSPNIHHENLFQAEGILLGAVFLAPELIHEITLEACHFSQKRNQLLFQAFRELQKENKPIDVVLVAEKLGTAIEDIGYSYMIDIAGCCPSPANYEHYQTIILNDYKLRMFQKAAFRILNEKTIDAAEDFYKLYTDMQDVGKVNGKSKRDILTEVYLEMVEDKGNISGIDTGFSLVNGMLNGLQNGDLIIVAARPSVGKTALAHNLAKNCCKNGGVVDFFSLEMPAIQLLKRMLSDISYVDGSKWKDPYHYFSSDDHNRGVHELGTIDQWNIHIHDQPRQTIADIRASIQKTKREHPNSNHLIVIDYLQLITQTKSFERQDLAVGNITRELKLIARQYEVPIILLSQLSRGVEQRADKRPVMSDLRDSGSIEQDADVIMLLSREDVEPVRSDSAEIINLNIAKHRNGPVGVIKLLFEKNYSRYRDFPV
ncbi:replicative DNA helicase [Neobacillus sp. DY30]|uniref:replicative DNA helicase n=1 Tax=Neobacillus sp. DY30 TaxID=3047871 RepID=UPI0024C0B350|nr:replicative DNA helicase [Neobacillus sp. DY30]WHY02749.1 replicative DNA helicase [Neobacillus sp. DY30]